MFFVKLPAFHEISKSCVLFNNILAKFKSTLDKFYLRNEWFGSRLSYCVSQSANETALFGQCYTVLSEKSVLIFCEM